MSVGYDTRWSRRKLDRARAHLAELERASAAWLEPTTHPLDVVLADDGGRVDVVLTFDEPPPLDEWSLIAGDCVHNIRTALDVFIWANSTLPLTGSQRRQVAYPILPYADEDDDPDASDSLEDQPTRTRGAIEQKIAGLPDPLRSRVLNNIRWASLLVNDDLVRHQALPVIAELDNVDKHRLALDVAASPNVLTWNIKGPDGKDVHLDLGWRPDIGMPIAHGERVVLASGRPDGPIDRILGGATVTLDLRVRLLDRSLNVLRWLGHFIEDVDGLLDVLSAPVTSEGPDPLQQ
jgi:hypothetical protein